MSTIAPVVSGKASLVVGMGFAGAIAFAGCATEEDVQFGEPWRVTTSGGFSVGATTGSGQTCQINGACRVSWRTQIYGQIFDAPLAGPEPSGGCGARDCHDEGAGNLVFPSGDADVAYDNLLAYDLPGGLPYVVPCEPALSHLLCNLRLERDVDNPYVGPDAAFSGACGLLMPREDDAVGARALTQEQLDLIVEWILCGAPNN